MDIYRFSYPRCIVLDNEVTKEYGFIWVYLDVLFTNILVKGSFDATIFRVKVDHELALFVLPHEETIIIGRDK